jgi:hypothetical protein
MRSIQALLAKGKTRTARIHNADSTVNGDIPLADLAPVKVTLASAPGLPDLVPDEVMSFDKLPKAVRLRFQGGVDGDVPAIKAELRRD